MTIYKGRTTIQKLPLRQGGYHYLEVEAAVGRSFGEGRSVRLLCTVNRTLTFPCGLNHLGNGNFFVILSKKHLQTLAVPPGHEVPFALVPDPNPLGVEMPEALAALWEIDAEAKEKFEALTVGKKRSLIHYANRIKDTDKKIAATLKALNEGLPTPRGPQSKR